MSIIYDWEKECSPLYKKFYEESDVTPDGLFAKTEKNKRLYDAFLACKAKYPENYSVVRDGHREYEKNE